MVRQLSPGVARRSVAVAVVLCSALAAAAAATAGYGPTIPPGTPVPGGFSTVVASKSFGPRGRHPLRARRSDTFHSPDPAGCPEEPHAVHAHAPAARDPQGARPARDRSDAGIRASGETPRRPLRHRDLWKQERSAVGRRSKNRKGAPSHSSGARRSADSSATRRRSLPARRRSY